MRDEPSAAGGVPHPVAIAIFVDERGGDWHARRLTRAFEARGARVVTTCLKDCAFDTSNPSGLSIPGFEDGLPTAAFVRSISDGSLEQITFRLGILHALEASGVIVWNPPRGIERSVDKSSATFLFQKAGLPVPATLTVEGRVRATSSLKQLGTPAVYKPLFGAQGVGVERVSDEDGLPDPSATGDVYYLQSMVDHRSKDMGPAADSGDGRDVYQDWRVLVSAGRVIAAMARRSKHWVTNVHQGAEPVLHRPDAGMSRLAIDAANAVGVDYGGVDLIRHSDGRLMVLEVNSNPAWRGLQSVAGVDIADVLAQDLIAAISARSSRRNSQPNVPVAPLEARS